MFSRPRTWLVLASVAILLASVIAICALGVEPRATAVAATRLTCSTVKPSGRIFHIDPINGSVGGDGSRARPWHQLQEVIDQGLVSQERSGVRLIDKLINRLFDQPITPYNERNNAASILDGDTIILHPGEYGDVHIRNHINRSHIIIKGSDQSSVIITSLKISGSSHFLFSDLNITSPLRENFNEYLLDLIFENGFLINRDLIFERISIGSKDKIASTSKHVWEQFAASGARLNGGCISLKNSRIHDVRYGASLYRASASTIANSEIRDFSIDGIDFSGEYLNILNNVIVNHWRPAGNLHPDCMQGQSDEYRPEYGPIRIEGNICIAHEAQNIDQQEYLQGISIFDGKWKDVTVRCNIILPNSQHGISLFGVQDALIEGNLILGFPRNRLTWIAALPAKNGRPPQNNRIFDNVATAYINAATRSPIASASLDTLRVADDKEIVKAIDGNFSGVLMQRNAWATSSHLPVSLSYPNSFRLIALDKPIEPLGADEVHKRYPRPRICS